MAAAIAYELDIDLDALGEALKRQLGLEIVPPGPAEAHRLPPGRIIRPRSDGLILRPVAAFQLSLGLEPAWAHWNLIPFFHAGAPKAWTPRMWTVPAEIVATTDPFRDPFRRRRCIVPATRLLLRSARKPTEVHALRRADGEPLFLAGFWERRLTDEGLADSFSMPTIAADKEGDLAALFGRRPAILDASSARLWLDLSADPTPALLAPPTGIRVVDSPGKRI